MSKPRVEAFSDGVIAVAITLLALDLDVPNPSGPGTLAHNLAQQWSSYAAYVVSFLTIGIIWINHHAFMRRLVDVDHAILLLNLVLLLTIGLLPFSTALMAEYLQAPQGQNLAAVVYGGSYLLMSVAFFIMQVHVLVAAPPPRAPHARPAPDSAAPQRHRRAPYVLATLGGIVSPYITLAICAILAVFFALPSTTPDTPPTERR